MKTLLKKLRKFGRQLAACVDEQSRRIKNSLLITVGGVVLVYITQLIFNSANVTLAIALPCDIIVLWKWMDAKRFLSLAAAGEALEGLGATDPPKSAEVIGGAEVPKLNVLFDLCLNVALYAIFWMHIFCFFVPLLSLQENPWLGFFFLVGGTAYVIMYPKGKIFRKTLVWTIVIALIVMFLQTISLTGWVKLGFMEPYFALRVSQTDKALANALGADKEANDAKNAARLETIAKSRREGKKLSPDDEKFLKEQELKNKGLIGGIIGKFSTPYAEAKTPSAEKSIPPPAPKKTLKKLFFPIEYIGGEKCSDESGSVKIERGGRATFCVNLPPLKANGRYKIHYLGQRETTGLDFLELNNGKGNSGTPLCVTHLATRSPIELVFFDEGYDVGQPGEAKYFRTGKNFFLLWAQNDILTVRLDQSLCVELTYWE